MKICFIAPANSVHIQKWSLWFKKHNHEVFVISLMNPDIDFGVKVYALESKIKASDSDWYKLKYLFHVFEVRKIVKELNPDIINVHYATSYGALAALSGIHNYVLSVWGSDVYEFPNKSILHKLLVKFSLWRARCLFSTSKAMAEVASKYTNKKFAITPFGVDMNLFSNKKRNRQDNNFIVGTVKTLSPQYGIATMLEAIAKVKHDHPEIPLKVRIAGSGSHEEDYHALAHRLGLDECLTWLGFISQDKAAFEWANFDCAIIPSESESFGVSAVEAQASGLPVIISDVPGLMEATDPGNTSVVVPRGNVNLLAEAIWQMYVSKDIRLKMGMNGRIFVREHYEVDNCFSLIESRFMEIANYR